MKITISIIIISSSSSSRSNNNNDDDDNKSSSRFRALQVQVTTYCNFIKSCTERPDWTELNWHGLFFYEVTNWQAVLHCRHSLTASVTTGLDADQFSSVTSLCTRLNSTLLLYRNTVIYWRRVHSDRTKLNVSSTHTCIVRTVQSKRTGNLTHFILVQSISFALNAT